MKLIAWALVAVCSPDVTYMPLPAGAKRGCSTVAFQYEVKNPDRGDLLRFGMHPSCHQWKLEAEKLGELLLFTCYEDPS